jgi:hypothetical protein
MMTHRSSMIVSGITLALAAAIGSAAMARAADFSAALTTPADARLHVSASGCSNSPGPTITLTGTIGLGDVTGDVEFKNNTKGTHTAVVTDVISGVVLDFGDGIQVPKQPSRTPDSPCTGTGTGGNPFVWIQLTDDDGNALTAPAFLGRCVQGLTVDTDLTFLEAALAHAHVGGDSCLNSPGPYITLSGDLTLRGVKGRVILKNNPNPPDPHEANCAATFDIIFADSSLTICKSPSTQQNACEYDPGAGGNPIVCVILHTDTSTSGEICLGRCNRL